MKKLFTLLLIPFLGLAQVAIPDQNFENKLIELGYDNVLDGQVGYNGTVVELDLSGSYIQDLTGIEAFYNLIYLDVSYNLLSQLDFSSLDMAEKSIFSISNLNLDFNPTLSFLNLSSAFNSNGNAPVLLSFFGTNISCIGTNFPGYLSNALPSYSDFFTLECGCTNQEASNYDSSATGDDGSCVIYGCMDFLACNFDANATNEISGVCDYSEEYYDCDGDCLIDLDEDGICDELEFLGCTDLEADNFNPLATDDDGTCYYTIYGCTDELACNYNALANEDFNGALCNYPEEYYDCDGVCLIDLDEDGICDELEVLGCTDLEADNFNPFATDDDGTCYYNIYGCTDELACNYNELANEDLSGQLCDYPEEYYDCYGECLLDLDLDSVCDELDNCPDNYNPLQEDFDFDSVGDACDGLYVNEFQERSKLIKVIDFLGRDVQEDDNEKIRLYIYDDGLVEKIIKL